MLRFNENRANADNKNFSFSSFFFPFTFFFFRAKVFVSNEAEEIGIRLEQDWIKIGARIMELDLRIIGNGERSVKAGRSGRMVCRRARLSDLFGVAVHAINNVVPSFSLFYKPTTVAMDGISLWCLFTVFIVLNGIVSTGRRKKTHRPQGRLHF